MYENGTNVTHIKRGNVFPPYLIYTLRRASQPTLNDMRNMCSRKQTTPTCTTCSNAQLDVTRNERSVRLLVKRILYRISVTFPRPFCLVLGRTMRYTYHNIIYLFSSRFHGISFAKSFQYHGYLVACFGFVVAIVTIILQSPTHTL